MCSMIGKAITEKPWGRRKTQRSWSGGTPTGAMEICVVLASAATGATAADTVVMEPPKTMSTLSSVTKRRALVTPLPGSEASSRMMSCTFSPAIVCGQSLNWLPTGMPRPEAGPVRDSVTPIFTSARALALASRAAAAARVVFNFRFIGCLLCGVGEMKRGRAGSTGHPSGRQSGRQSGHVHAAFRSSGTGMALMRPGSWGSRMQKARTSVPSHSRTSPRITR